MKFRLAPAAPTLTLTLSLLLALSGGLPARAALTEAPQPRTRVEAGIDHMVPDAAFSDLSGKPLTLAGLTALQPFTVIAITSPTCPLSRKLAPTLAALEKAWKDKGVQFVFAGAIASDPPESLAALAREHGFKGPATTDATQSLLTALRPGTTTEVLVLDRARTLLYRGAVDDQYGIGYQKAAPTQNYLADALTALTAGKSPRLAATTAPGCALEIPAPPATPAPAAPTWHREVSRIVAANCQACHRPGGTGPFPMMTPEDVGGHAAMIKKVIAKGLMPPWFAAPQTGPHALTWENDRTLSQADRDTLTAWLSGDRALGDPKDAPVPRSWPADWLIGTPDTVVEIPTPVEVQATGRMKYQYREYTTTFPEDRWVTAYEVRPSAVEQVHHVLVFAAGANGKKVTDGDDFFAAYVPGSSAVFYPDGYAKKLPAGSRLIFQLHYTPNGTAAVDRTRLGLRFSTTPPVHEVHVAAAKQRWFSIPPGAPNHEVKGTLPVPFDAQILSFMPHMHMRGKAFRYDLVDAAGASRELLNVPAYDFNWQLLYRAAQPITAKAGSRIQATAWFDNSAENPNNPDPTKTVRWGDQTEEEMMIGYLEYVKTPAPAETAAAPDANSSSSTDGTPSTTTATTATAPAASTPEPPLALTPKALGVLGRRLDADRDNRVSREEAGPNFLALHERLDQNKDGFVTADEAKAAARP